MRTRAGTEDDGKGNFRAAGPRGRAEERLDVEYKAWLDLGDRAVQADLAKHLCALANNGSGYVVFGIADDMTSVREPPEQAGPYDRESLSGIVKRFLTPEFQVEVYHV